MPPWTPQSEYSGALGLFFGSFWGGPWPPLGPSFPHTRLLLIFSNTLTPNLGFQGPQGFPFGAYFLDLLGLSGKPPLGRHFFMHRLPNLHLGANRCPKGSQNGGSFSSGGFAGNCADAKRGSKMTP